MIRPLRMLIVDPRCPLCLGVSADGAFCGGCLADLPWNRICCPVCALPQKIAALPCARCAAEAPPFDFAWSAFRYTAPVTTMVADLKYRAQLPQARLLGRAMAEMLAARSMPLPELLLPVPLHSSRLRRRGYNQALELARGIASRLAIPVDADAARRLRPTPDQIGTSAAQRRRNVKGAFAVDARLAGRHLALIDDVMTTGATVSELARVCRKAGAARIEVWTATRAV